MNKKNITISCIIAIILGVILLIIYNSTPKTIFKSRLNFELPKSAKVINSTYISYIPRLPLIEIYREERFFAKIFFTSDDYDKIDKGLKNFFGAGYDIGDEAPEDFIPKGFSITASWWDMNESELQIACLSFKSGKIIRSVSQYAFVTKNNDDEYYLYVVI